MPEPGAAVLVARPSSGRIFDSSRRVRLADVDPTGRCRLDAAVRYLQDMARDDSAASGLADPMNWVVRRTLLEVRVAPVFQEALDLATWCSGHGRRWAERRTEIRGEHGAVIDAATIWVYIDAVTGKPMTLGDDFFSLYGETAAERTVSARKTLPTAWPDDAADEKWPVRFSDLDVLGHVNNAAQWTPVEEVLDRVGCDRSALRAELEHGPGIERGTDVRLRWRAVDGGVDTWLTTDGVAASVARVRPLG